MEDKSGESLWQRKSMVATYKTLQYSKQSKIKVDARFRMRRA